MSSRRLSSRRRRPSPAPLPKLRSTGKSLTTPPRWSPLPDGEGLFRQTCQLCEPRNARVSRARERQKDQDQAVETPRILARETGDDRRAEAARQRLPALAALRESGGNILVHETFTARATTRAPAQTDREYGDELPRKSSVASKQDNRRRFSRVSPACEISARRYRPVAPRNARECLGHPREHGGNPPG